MVKYEQALKIIDEYNCNYKTKSCTSIDALGYVLAHDVYSNCNVPHFRKSAMDGYALKGSSDLQNSFYIIDTIYAGNSHNPKLNENECVKIMTGAPVPDEADIVIVKELATEEHNRVKFAIPTTKLNHNICEIGEDIAKGQLLFSKGTYLTSAKISSLISVGIFEVTVYEKPSILVLTTGDEVINDHSQLKRGQIYNSNLAYLKNRLVELGFTCDSSHLKDDVGEIQQHLNPKYDLIITTGAISVGDRDIIRNYINNTSPNVHFDRVNIMPGGPCVFWDYNNIPIISLAGSPFANFVTFELFARRLISRLTMNEQLIAKESKVQFNGTFSKDIKKTRFIKAQLTNNIVTLPANNHLASSMHEMTLCNCLIRLERGLHELRDGDCVTVLNLRRNNE